MQVRICIWRFRANGVLGMPDGGGLGGPSAIEFRPLPVLSLPVFSENGLTVWHTAEFERALTSSDESPRLWMACRREPGDGAPTKSRHPAAILHLSQAKEEHTMRFVIGILTVCVAVSFGDSRVFAADQAADQTAIEEAIEAYTAAYNAKDAKTLAAHWSPEAIYINPLTGNQVEGREAIEKEFAEILTELGDTKLAVDVEAIRFISPSVAVENGVAKLISAEGEPSESSYTAIHVKRDGKWLLDRVTEEDVPVVQSHYEQLKELEWMIGTWIDGDDQGHVETTCQWTRNKNFITRSFTVSIDDRIDMAGMQIIGWDPASQQVRSWVFDSDGGFGLFGPSRSET